MSELALTHAAHLEQLANLDRAKAEVILSRARVSKALADYARSGIAHRAFDAAQQALAQLRDARRTLNEEHRATTEDQIQSDARMFELECKLIQSLHAKDAE